MKEGPVTGNDLTWAQLLLESHPRALPLQEPVLPRNVVNIGAYKYTHTVQDRRPTALKVPSSPRCTSHSQTYKGSVPSLHP